MLLSDILKEYRFADDVTIISEKSFEHLGLTASAYDGPMCTFLDSSKYIDDIKPNVQMVITTNEIAEILKQQQFGVCIVNRPREAFFMIHNFLAENNEKTRKKRKTIFGKDCQINQLASVAKHDVEIGDHVTIEEFVVIRPKTKIGDHTIIRAGSIIGGQGFEFKRTDNGLMSVSHVGGVIIGKNVEIQYNTCVDRGLYEWDSTIIGDHCKIDNLVHIAHGVKIGKDTMVVANAGIGGRTVIGERTWVGFGATISNGIVVGDDARANIGAVVTKSMSDGESCTGNFAVEHAQFIKNLKRSIAEK